jgi:sulfate adenylyltransferase large subunit
MRKAQAPARQETLAPARQETLPPARHNALAADTSEHLSGTITQDLAPLAALNQRPLLRFITCGSVDDGKSTLIGRVLYDAHAVLDDQISALQSDSKRFGTQGEAMDFALLVDGLAAEREQGITIDVAYRYFATARRKFIVADTPGHEQYTRNMATGASTADLAVILIDARKGVQPQTRRHAFIVSMLGVKQVVVAVNKMDLVDYSPVIFGRIEGEFRAFASTLGFADIAVIPVAAVSGANVSKRAPEMTWYDGPTLITHLENVDIAISSKSAAFRMAVQWVNRPDADFRGFSGLISEGRVRPGDRIRALPSGKSATVARVIGGHGDMDEGIAGQSVTITLSEEIDVSRGDVLADFRRPAPVGDSLDARLLWMSERALEPGRPYLLKIGTATVTAIVEAPRHRVDINTLKNVAAPTLRLNEIGVARLKLDRPLAMERYNDMRSLGGFILIDRVTYDTVAMGLVEQISLADTAPSPSTDESYAGMEGIAPTSSPIILGEGRRRSLAKTLSWQLGASLITLALAYAITRDTTLSAAIAALDAGVKFGPYYLHERFWAGKTLGMGPRNIRPRSTRPSSTNHALATSKTPNNAGEGI